MVRGYRGIVLAIAGLILIGAGKPLTTGNQSQEAQAAAKIEEAGNSIASAIIQVGKPIEKDGGCENRKDNRNSELCAQWKAADSAEEAANWAWWQLWLSALGVLGLGFTLWFNFRALRMAKDASKETKDALTIAKSSAESASNLVRISDRNAHLELRAYLEFDSVKVEPWPDYDNPENPKEKGFRIQIGIRNYGRTPAQNVELTKTSKTFQPNDKKFFEITVTDNSNLNNIAPSDIFYMRYHWRIPDYILEKIIIKEMYLIFCLIVTYTDIFQKPHILKADFEGRGINEDFFTVEGSRAST